MIGFCEILARRSSKFLELEGCLSAYLIIWIEFNILEFTYVSGVLYKVGLGKEEQYFHALIWSKCIWHLHVGQEVLKITGS